VPYKFLTFLSRNPIVFPDSLHLFIIMKRASSESASSAAPMKKPSIFNNTDGFTAESIPPNHYHLGVDNFAVISDFGNVINVHIRKFRSDENGRIFPIQKWC
ncbi:hypothetical protein AVEN_269202-1, partial [Araneus ventricosus]